MIFYFSGTGNSKFAAEFLAEKTNDKILEIGEQINGNNFTFCIAEGEKIGFVFPIYAWQPPKIVKEFLSRLTIAGINDKTYTYSVITCGSDVGKGFALLEKQLHTRRLHLNGKASLAMPDNYIVMYDVGSQSESAEKVKKAKIRLAKIAEKLVAEKSFEDIERTAMPAFKSYVIGAFFNKFLTSPKKFYAEKTCTSCGLCEKICPTKNIKVDKTPVWGNNCTVCLACIHRCPVRAIQYGKGTKARGRYYFYNNKF